MEKFGERNLQEKDYLNLLDRAHRQLINNVKALVELQKQQKILESLLYENLMLKLVQEEILTSEYGNLVKARKELAQIKEEQRETQYIFYTLQKEFYILLPKKSKGEDFTLTVIREALTHWSFDNYKPQIFNIKDKNEAMLAIAENQKINIIKMIKKAFKGEILLDDSSEEIQRQRNYRKNNINSHEKSDESSPISSTPSPIRIGNAPLI